MATHDLGTASSSDGRRRPGGFQQGRDGGFTARHQELQTSKGTIRLRPDDADAIGDDELRDLVRATLAG